MTALAKYFRLLLTNNCISSILNGEIFNIQNYCILLITLGFDAQQNDLLEYFKEQKY